MHRIAELERETRQLREELAAETGTRRMDVTAVLHQLQDATKRIAALEGERVAAPEAGT